MSRDLRKVQETEPSSDFFDRLWDMAPAGRERAIRELIERAKCEIPNMGEFSGVSATTNAVGWDIELDGDFLDGPPGVELEIPLSLEANGDQMDGRFYYGHRIRGTVVAVIGSQGRVRFDNFHLRVVDESGD